MWKELTPDEMTHLLFSTPPLQSAIRKSCEKGITPEEQAVLLLAVFVHALGTPEAEFIKFMDSEFKDSRSIEPGTIVRSLKRQHLWPWKSVH